MQCPNCGYDLDLTSQGIISSPGAAAAAAQPFVLSVNLSPNAAGANPLLTFKTFMLTSQVRSLDAPAFGLGDSRGASELFSARKGDVMRHGD